ncbi:MAG TPA: HlyD family efflux transporter periplasmic adaptor subunit [Steroidobacteraceae bacterium]|nr:HlyD family efflux transporter periplasmic adaptor subunit [Steroidobacteraceae bacterium]
MIRNRAIAYGSRLLLATLGALALAGCHPGAAAGKDAAAAPPPSPYATIANGKVDVEGGVVEVAARRAGVISAVYVQEGDLVHKGQVLARQEDEDSRLAEKSAAAAVAQAESQMPLLQVNARTAQREYERLRGLAATKLVSQQQLDQASDAVASAQAQLGIQQAAVQTARAQLAQAEYNQDLTIIRAPMDGKIIRRYANPGAGASTLNVSDMFDLEPATSHIVRAEIVESAIPMVHVAQEVEITSEDDPSKVSVGSVIRIAATFGARKLKSDSANEAADERVVEVVVSADNTPYLIGQRVLVKFMKPGQRAGVKR